MGSRNPPPDLYAHDPESPEALGQAFDAHDPIRDFERDSELKPPLSEKLSMLAADGVTDPIELREWALESLLLR